jgi:GR25 family glycosyltransferase involved in LPS biosynthesis
MIDIYNIPFYYIGFKKNPKLEKSLKQVGFQDVNHFQAIDGRKMDPKKLLNDNTIGIRAYHDLVYGREEHTAISSLGTIGCTLSHLELWKKCANNLSYIIIAEDDVIPKKISESDKTNIQKALEVPNGCFISTPFKKGEKTLMGLHFYFLSQGAAQKLSNKALPIDMQTDSYVGSLNNIGEINAEGYTVFAPRFRSSSTSDKGFCIKCFLPSGRMFYIIIMVAIIFIIIFCVVFFKKWKTIKVELDSCRSSQNI